MNYQKQLEITLESIQKSIYQSAKPSLLLHACCAPCSSYVLEYLAKYFFITVFYYNPNIYPKAEYIRRLTELCDFLPRFIPAIKNGVQMIKADYKPEEYFNATCAAEEIALQTEKERGVRCQRCYKFRLEKAYEYAAFHGFDWCTTTLSISPFKDANKINAIGMLLEQNMERRGAATKFLSCDFKKKEGFKRSLEISREYGLYRQTYCGCIYSYRARQKYDGQQRVKERAK